MVVAVTVGVASGGAAEGDGVGVAYAYGWAYVQPSLVGRYPTVDGRSRHPAGSAAGRAVRWASWFQGADQGGQDLG